ncbi:MAG: site-specific integrase [Rikenellaceae bacterium]
MKTTTQETFSVLFMIKRSKALKNGNYPIVVRVSVRGQVAEISIQRNIAPSMWNQIKGCCKGRDHDSLALNNYIASVRSKLIDIHTELVRQNEIITANRIKDLYINVGRQDEAKGLCEIYQEHNERCRSLIGIDFAESTVLKFDSSLKSLRDFIWVKYRKKEYRLQDLDVDFMRDFDFYLKTVRKCQHNSAIKHLKNLKKIVRQAVNSNLLERNPFLGYTIIQEDVDREFLDESELTRIIEKDFACERVRQVRDVFVFCCFTGMAYADVNELAQEHIFTDGQGALWIKKRRKKTKVLFNVPILPPAKAIIDRYSNAPECAAKGVLLPVISNQKMNVYLKEIADVCGIEKLLTTHVARHTCATTVMLAHNVRIENVAKILGHKNIKMTQHYAKVLDKSIMIDMAGVEARFGAVAAR